MDKKIAGLLGAAAALTAVNGAQAAAPAQSSELSPAASYRELLGPVPNPLAALKADNARLAETQASDATRLAQVYYHHHHHHGWYHHHHHHHGWWNRYRYYHHHHHHHW